MLSEVPFRPRDPEGIALAQCFRDVISRVRVMPPDPNGILRLEITLDPLQRRRGEGGAPASGFGLEVLHVSLDVLEARRAERVDRDAARCANLDEAAATGRHDVSDAEWALVRPIVEAAGLDADGRPIEPRPVFDAMICLAKEGGPIDRVPARYGDPREVLLAVKRLIYSGRWDAAVAVLRAEGAPCVAGARLERFDTTEYPRSRPGERPCGSTAAKDRRTLLKLAAAEPDGHLMRLRYQLVASVLAGDGIAAAARSVGVTATAAYHYWDNYKRHGIDALHRKPGPTKQSYLTPTQAATLRAHAEKGVDPDAPDKPMTYPVLCRICLVSFGVEYSTGGMIQLCRRLGFLLRPFVLRASRERLAREAGERIVSAAQGSPAARRRVASPASRLQRRRRREGAGARPAAGGGMDG